MTSTYEQPGQQSPQHPEPGPACDVGALDDLACESEGVKAQAEYTASKEADRLRRRAAFDTARTEYATARSDASVQVNELRHRLDQLRDQLRCRLSRRVIDCLEEAWDEVWDELRKCQVVEVGCCLDDDEQCEFETGCEGVSDQDLLTRKAAYERRVKAAEDCFDALVGEPAKLTARVAELKSEVDAIATEAADPDADVKKIYARLLWTWRRLQDVWVGFDDAGDFLDCLCRGLTCSVRGHKAIAVIVGELAVRACRKRGEHARCDELRSHVVEEILSAFLRVCPPTENGDGYGEQEKPEEKPGYQQSA
jgi:hypothetical protein